MRIFVSYRRSDSRMITGRLWQQLCGEVGRENVFFDHDSLPPGRDFPSQIATAIQQSQVVLVVIGPTWVTATRDGLQRLGQPDDHVRREVELALEHVEVVVPVLVEGATVPEPGSLPESLRPLVTRTGVQLREDPDFLPDAERLIARLRRSIGDAVPATAAAAQGTLAERCRAAGQAGRWEECLDLARRLLDPSRGSSIDDLEEGVEWLLFGRRWDEAADLLPAAAADLGDDPATAARRRLLTVRLAQARGGSFDIDLPGVAAELRRLAGASAPATTRARVELATDLVWSDEDTGRAAAMLGELADDIVHSYRDDPFGAVWQRLWLLAGVIRNEDAAVREAALRLAATTEVDARALGADHPLAALAAVLHGWLAGTDPDAESLISSAIRGVGRSHPIYAWLASYEAGRRIAAGDVAGAVAFRAQQVSWTEEAFGLSHPATLTVLGQLAWAQQEGGRPQEAVRTATTVLERCRATDPGSAAVLAAAWDLGWALTKDSSPDRALAMITDALRDSHTAHDDAARVNAEVAALQFASQAGDLDGIVERVDLLLASRPPEQYADWVIPFAHREARDALDRSDRIEEALGHAIAVQPGVDEELDEATALDVLALAHLRHRAKDFGAAVELLDGVWPDLDRALPSRAVGAFAALLREASRAMDEPDTQALLEAFEACAALPKAEFDEAHHHAKTVAALALMLLAAFGLADQLSDLAMEVATDRMIDALPEGWVYGSQLAEAAAGNEDLLPSLTRLLEALPAQPEPVAAHELGGALALIRAWQAWDTQAWLRRAAGELPPPSLRRAGGPRALIERMAEVWDQSAEADTDPADLAELDVLAAYAALDGGPWPAGATRALAERLADLRSRYGGGADPRGPWDVPLPADRTGRRLVAGAALGFGLGLLRSAGSRAGTSGQAGLGADLFAATVLRLNVSGGHLLGDRDWLWLLPNAVPIPVREKLLQIDSGFAGLATRGAAGWLGEEVPDLFQNAPVRDRPWQHVAQGLFDQWAGRKLAELPDPYGRYQDGSWPVPPPGGDLPDAYADLAARLRAAASDGFLFG